MGTPPSSRSASRAAGALLLAAGLVAALASGCGKRAEERPCPKISQKEGGANCVYGKPGGPCAELVTPASCREGRWICPLGMILYGQCQAAADAGAGAGPGD